MPEMMADSPRHGFRGERPTSARRGVFPASLTIAVSREAGSRGTDIARRAGKKLGWQIYNQELLEYIAQEGTFRQDMVDHLLGPNGRQIKSNAHPLVEITLMRQPGRNRTLVHLVNGSGHSDTAYFAPIEMRDVEVQVKGGFSRARAVGLDRALDITSHGEYSLFVVPSLKGYEVIVLE